MPIRMQPRPNRRAPPPPCPPAAIDPRAVALAELGAYLDRLADLIARVSATQATPLRRRWLRLRYDHHLLAREIERAA